jgi:hypothetical protein
MGPAETVEAKMWAKMFEFENSSVAINTSQRSQKTKRPKVIMLLEAESRLIKRK